MEKYCLALSLAQTWLAGSPSVGLWRRAGLHHGEVKAFTSLSLRFWDRAARDLGLVVREHEHFAELTLLQVWFMLIQNIQSQGANLESLFSLSISLFFSLSA